VPRRISLLVLVFLLLLIAPPARGAGMPRLYTPSYGSSAGQPEMIGGFELAGNGALSPIPGSPFPGTTPTAAGGLTQLAFAPDGTRAASAFLFSGGVQSYRVPASGIFELGNTPPTASATSVAITPDGRFAYFPTREFPPGKPAEGIRGFAFGADGLLTSLGPGASVGGDSYDLAITPDGRFLFAGNLAEIRSFAIGGDGSLTPLGSIPAPGSFHMAVSPDGRFLFAQLSAGLASYAIGGDGSLTKIGPTAMTGDFATRVPVVAPDGRHLYVPSYNEDLIITVAVAADGTLSIVGGGTPVVDPEAIGISPDGRFLVFYRSDTPALGVASIGVDGVPTILPFEVPWSTGEPERIVFQPQPTPVARFTAEAGVPGGASRFDASGSTNASRYEWNFGDGTTLADGGPTPSHAYAKAGAYDVTLSVFDRNGCGASHDYDGQSTVCPGGSTTTARGTVDTLPLLGKPKAVPKKFAPKLKGAKKGKAKGGTTFRFKVSENARVRFTIERKRKKSGRARFKRVGSLRKKGKAGLNKLKWNGKAKGKPLAPGAYRATVVAIDPAGGQSPPKRVGFRILPLSQQR
jgi:PKD domain/Lactonase, 7-bladed beta-propeller